MASSTSTARAGDRSLRDVVGVVIEKQTYKNLLYLGLAFPLGMLYFSVLLFGFVLGMVLAVVVLGLAILFGTLVAVRIFATFERWLANALLDTDVDPTDDLDTSDGGFPSTVRAYVDAASTWRGTGFLLAKFWVGILGFLVLFFLLTAVSVLTAPLRYPHTVEFGTVNDEPVTWAIDTVPEAVLAVPLGVILVIAVLHVVNGFAYVCGRMAEALLGATASDESSGASDEPTGGSDQMSAASESAQSAEPETDS